MEWKMTEQQARDVANAANGRAYREEGGWALMRDGIEAAVRLGLVALVEEKCGNIHPRYRMPCTRKSDHLSANCSINVDGEEVYWIAR